MAKRLTDTDIWDKEWFMQLSPKLKCLVKFVRDKCDLAGVWNPNWRLAEIYIGESVTESELVSIDSGKQFVKLENGKIYCIDFVQFQNGKLTSKSPIHTKILSLLESHGIPYPYPINRVLDTPIVEVIVGVGVKEVVGVKEKVEVAEGVFLKNNEIEKAKMVFKENYDMAISTLSNYKLSSGKKYKSDYHALVGWVQEKIMASKIKADKPSKTEETIEIINRLMQKSDGNS